MNTQSCTQTMDTRLLKPPVPQMTTRYPNMSENNENTRLSEETSDTQASSPQESIYSQISDGVLDEFRDLIN